MDNEAIQQLQLLCVFHQSRETFYRTPLVAHLLDYVREYRQHAEVAS